MRQRKAVVRSNLAKIAQLGLLPFCEFPRGLCASSSSLGSWAVQAMPQGDTLGRRDRASLRSAEISAEQQGHRNTMEDLKRDKDSTKQFQKERFGAFPPPADNEVDDLDGPIDPSDPIFGSRMSSRDLPKSRRVLL